MATKRKKFTRRNHDKYSRLGWGRRKKQIWRRPEGIHSKMRERRKGYPARPEIGMKSTPEKVKLIRNMKELMGCSKGEKVIIARIGRKLRTEMVKKAADSGIKIMNERKTGK